MDHAQARQGDTSGDFWAAKTSGYLRMLIRGDVEGVAAELRGSGGTRASLRMCLAQALQQVIDPATGAIRPAAEAGS